MKKEDTNSRLRKNYPLLMEAGIICSLLIFIFAMKFDIPDQAKENRYIPKSQEPPIILPPITQTKKEPPAPIRPQVPVEVPDDSPLALDNIELPGFDDWSADKQALPPLPPDDSDDDDEIVEFAQFMPEMKGGIKALYRDLEYPEIARKNGIEGRVVVEFVVNKKGEIENPKIIRGIGAGCDEAVLRAIQKQQFTPGIQGGTFVKVRMRQAVRFEIDQ